MSLKYGEEINGKYYDLTDLVEDNVCEELKLRIEEGKMPFAALNNIEYVNTVISKYIDNIKASGTTLAEMKDPECLRKAFDDLPYSKFLSQKYFQVK